MTTFKELPVGTRLFRAAGLGILTISFVYCGYLVYTVATTQVITGQSVEGSDLIILIVSLILAALSGLVMTADAWDFWMHDPRAYSLNDVRKVQLAVLIVLGLALVMSALVVTWALFMTIAPALIIYLFLVVRPTNEAAVKELKESEKQRKAAKRRGPTASRSSQPAVSRQRRGGRKHR